MFQFLSRRSRRPTAYDHGMEQPRDAARVREAVLGVIAVLVSGIAFLLPTLAVGLDSASVASALLAVAVAALVGTAHATGVLAGRTASGLVTTRRAPPPVLATRATDPTHHPLRPRAPGTV